MRAVAYIFLNPTSGVWGPDTLWRVPKYPLSPVNEGEAGRAVAPNPRRFPLFAGRFSIQNEGMISSPFPLSRDDTSLRLIGGVGMVPPHE